MTEHASRKQQEFSAGIKLSDGANEPLTDDLTISQKWTKVIGAIRSPVHRVILLLADHAARHPVSYIVGVIFISVLFIVTGLFTNFSVDVDEDTLWTPMRSRPLSHGEWISGESGFNKEPRNFLGLIHRRGANVLGLEGVRRSFDAIDIVRQTKGYDALCYEANHQDFNGRKTCPLYAVTSFWNDTQITFEASVSTDYEATVELSAGTFPNGAPVDQKLIFGKTTVDENGMLSSAESLSFIIMIPDEEGAEKVEELALNKLFDLQDAWLAEEGNDFVLQVFAERSFSDEFSRAIVNDIPLVPIVFVIMSIFTCIVFWRRDWVMSQSLLGLGAVCTVFFAIMTGYGIMFMAGVPFTSMTQILPFIMFGIGLDNAFIIHGEYARMDKTKTAIERVHDTIDDVGLSIFLTTATSVVAFALGTLSSIPAVFWLCQYAAPTIFINFLYQITFFVALIIIDEKRVVDRRRDCLVCLTVKSRVECETEEDINPKAGWVDRFMGWYADILFNPFVTAFVLVGFAGLTVGCAYSASQLSQDFKFTDVVPKDSYVADFWDDFTAFSERSGVSPGIYFRDVNQCDPQIQQQMEEYVADIVGLDEVKDPPTFFWLHDFKSFVNSTQSLRDMTCKDQINAFLEVQVYFDIYNKHIVRNQDGEVTASRTFVRMDVDQEEVTEQVDALNYQRDVTQDQSINGGRKDWAFFTFDGIYYIWEFYSVAPRELIQSTIAGVVAVSLLGLIFIPHWTAMFFVAPMISILYVDLLGVLQFAGISVNAVSYIALVMSIGLLVDFLMHVLLRYYESNKDGRKAKVKDTLETMGASILIGAISTFLGVIPLAFSSSNIFSTIFITFVGLVTLGASHGLILLPVLLSLMGPIGSIKKESKVDATKQITEDANETADADGVDAASEYSFEA